jgi:hypothetical protein
MSDKEILKNRWDGGIVPWGPRWKEGVKVNLAEMLLCTQNLMKVQETTNHKVHKKRETVNQKWTNPRYKTYSGPCLGVLCSFA